MSDGDDVTKAIKASVLEARDKEYFTRLLAQAAERTFAAEETTERYRAALERATDGLELAYKATKMRALKRLKADALEALKGAADA